MGMQAVSVAEFLRTGWLGPIGPGSTEATVREVWGAPTHWRLTRPPSRSYGPVMLFLDGDVVTHAGLYLRDHDRQEPPFVLDIEFQSIDGFYRTARSAGLTYESGDQIDGEAQLTVLRIIESGVEVVFDKAGALAQVVSNPIEARHGGGA